MECKQDNDFSSCSCFFISMFNFVFWQQERKKIFRENSMTKEEEGLVNTGVRRTEVQ